MNNVLLRQGLDEITNYLNTGFMRTIITSLMLILSALNSFAQEKSKPTEHLLFMDTPIDGALTEYVSKMKNMGFTRISVKNGTAILRGNFATYEDCFHRINAKA